MESSNKTYSKYAWVVLITVGFAAFFTYFHRMSAGVIKGDLTETFGLTATSFGTMSSMCFYPYMLMQLPCGILADKWGVRRTTALGCLITAIGTGIFSMAQGFGMACAGRMIVGLGIATPVVCMQKVASTWFRPEKAATASAIAGTIGNCGSLFAQTPLAVLVGYLGWRLTFGGAAAVTLAFAVIAFLLLRDDPSELGRGSTGAVLSKEEKTEDPAPEAKGVQTKEHTPLPVILKSIFSNRYVLFTLVIMFVQMGIYQMFSGAWGISFLSDVYGYSTIEASGFTSWMMVGMIIFYLAMPVISDRMHGRKTVLVLISAVTLAVWALIAFGSGLLSSPAVITPVMLLMGFTSSSFPLLFSLIREYNDPRYIGTAIGACNMIGMSAGAVFPIICGAIIDRQSAAGVQGSALYSKAFAFAVVLALIALLASMLVKETHCKNVYKQASSK